MKTQFYEPLIKEEQPQTTALRGFQVQIGGVYVLLDDVVTVLREYAQSLEDAEQGALVHEIATWLVSGERPSQTFESSIEALGHEPITKALAGTEPPHGQEDDDVTPDVERVEIYPVKTARGIRWHARSIDTGGNIMKVTDGSFDQTWVIQNAEDRWPNVPIHLVQNAGDDSMWLERERKGPSPKRLWAGT